MALGTRKFYYVLKDNFYSLYRDWGPKKFYYVSKRELILFRSRLETKKVTTRITGAGFKAIILRPTKLHDIADMVRKPKKSYCLL